MQNQEYLSDARSTTWLLMPWQRHRLYWYYEIGRHRFFFMWKYCDYLCCFCVEEWYETRNICACIVSKQVSMARITILSGLKPCLRGVVSQVCLSASSHYPTQWWHKHECRFVASIRGQFHKKWFVIDVIVRIMNLPLQLHLLWLELQL